MQLRSGDCPAASRVRSAPEHTAACLSPAHCSRRIPLNSTHGWSKLERVECPLDHRGNGPPADCALPPADPLARPPDRKHCISSACRRQFVAGCTADGRCARFRNWERHTHLPALHAAVTHLFRLCRRRRAKPGPCRANEPVEISFGRWHGHCGGSSHGHRALPRQPPLGDRVGDAACRGDACDRRRGAG